MKRVISLLLTAVLLLTLIPAGALADNDMKASDDIKTRIKGWEGIRLKAYNATPREAELGYWTIGYGHLLGVGDYKDLEIDEATADAWFEEDIIAYEDSVNRFAAKYGYTLTQNEFDALLSLAYNFGTSWIDYYNWPACQMLRNGYKNYPEIEFANALASLCHSGDVAYTGLLKRRMIELNMLLYDESCFMPYDNHFVYTRMFADGGTYPERNYGSGFVLPGSDVQVYFKGQPYGTLPVIKKSGAYFDGWQTEYGYKYRNDTIAEESLDLFALWSDTPTAKWHNLTVKNGSGSGYYQTGDVITIAPNAMDYLVLSQWEDSQKCISRVDEGGNIRYYVTMPDSDVTVEVIYDCPLGDRCPAKSFTDVRLDYWGHNAIDYVVGTRMFNGTSKSTFSPEDTMTRAMLVTVLYRLSGSPDVTELINPFADIAEGTWYYNAVLWAYNEGITKGSGGKDFSPNAYLTREQLATFLLRYSEHFYEFGYDGSDYDLSAKFKDADAVQSYALNAVKWAVSEKIIAGYNDSTLRPGNSAKRVEVATMLMRYTSGINF